MTFDENTISDETQKAMAKAAVLSARDAVREIEEALGISVDLRSFMVGGAAMKGFDVPIPTAVLVGVAMEVFEPEIARLEMEQAAEGDAFADLPIFDPENGS